MDYRLVPFKRWHMAWLSESGPADGTQSVVGVEALMQLEAQNSWTLVADGTPVACGGTVEQWPGRHTGWAYLGVGTGRYMVAVTRHVRQKLAQVKGRIEVTVRCDFEVGHRWARMLGFEIETPEMKGYGPEGESHTAYVRFNEE